jgi:ABC-type lipoprotein export system ATPase subunit
MALTVTNLTKEYVRGKIPFKAVNDVNFTVKSGDFITIIGRSGSGKSTLLNVIAGLLRPTSGSIEIDGINIVSLSDKEASQYRNSKIGYVPQGQSTLASLSVIDNVRLPYYLFKREKDITELALSLLNKTGIFHLKDTYPKQLSGGELKRIAIARALINSPDYIILDEPTSDLDTQTTKEIMELLKEISEAKTAVIMVTHEMDVLEYGDDTYVMDSGVLTK